MVVKLAERMELLSAVSLESMTVELSVALMDRM